MTATVGILFLVFCFLLIHCRCGDAAREAEGNTQPETIARREISLIKLIQSPDVVLHTNYKRPVHR